MTAKATSAETLDALRAELGAELPPGVSALQADALRDLLVCIRAQKAQQRSALESAITQGLTVVPAILRGAVRKVLFKAGS